MAGRLNQAPISNHQNFFLQTVKNQIHFSIIISRVTMRAGYEKEIVSTKNKKNEKKAIEELKNGLKKIIPDAEIILFGSKARGNDSGFSDIDLLILIDSPVDTAVDKLIVDLSFPVELKYDVIFGLSIENKNTWNLPLMKATPFHENIDAEGIHL